MSENLIQQQQELTGLIERHSLQNSTKETAVPSLFFYQHSSITEPAYRVYKPSFCVVVQGLKEILLAQERFEYGPSNYLIASMNLPVIGQIIKASADSPYLSLKLEFTQNQILEVLNDCDIKVTSKDNAKRALFVGWMESSIQDAVLRLARLLDTPGEIPFLAPLYTRRFCTGCCRGPMESNWLRLQSKEAAPIGSGKLSTILSEIGTSLFGSKILQTPPA